MTTETLITATDDTAAAQQDAVQPVTDAPQGDPATTPPQDAATPETKGETSEVQEYETFAVPEGVGIDEEILGEFKQVAKDLKLPQEAAQRLADLSSKMALKQQAEMHALHSEWAEKSKTDKEFGGEAFAENLAVAKSAVDAFASPELKALLTESGLGNHPEVIRTFIRIGKQIRPDSTLPSGSATPTQGQDARRLYAASQMNP